MSGDNQFFKQVQNMLKKAKRSYDEAVSFASAIKDPALRKTANQSIQEFKSNIGAEQTQ